MTETKTKKTKNLDPSTNSRDSFVDMSKLFKFKEWTAEDKAIYPLIYFIFILLFVAILNIGMFGMGSDFTNQTFFGHEVNGSAGAATETEVTKQSFWYGMAWVIVFAALIASVCQFMSNIFLTKFSKKFIWFNQISMMIWLVIDIMYGAWWIALTQIVGLVLSQARYVAWDKTDSAEEDGVDPYASTLDLKFIIMTVVGLVMFFVIGMLLLTPIAFEKEHFFYTIVETSPGMFVMEKISKTGGLLYDGAAWFDLVAGVFQIGGLILMIRKTWACWLMWEIAEIGMIVTFAKAGNMVMVAQNVLLFASNLIPLVYWFIQNKKSKERAQKGEVYIPS